MRLELADVSARHGTQEVLRGVSFALGSGEVLAVIGPSGAGKSTLLALVAGLHAHGGSVRLDGRDAAELAPRARGFGMVFQELALWPHLTLAQHLEFVLANGGVARAERRERALAVLAEVELAPLAARRPHELSGGEAQRLALARALVGAPRALLLDEPLGQLDGASRTRLVQLLSARQARQPLTTLLVTHAFDEACALAARVAVLVGGHLAQLAPPAELWSQPCTRAVAEVVGSCSFVRGRRQGTRVELPFGVFEAGFAPGAMGEVGLLVRPETFVLGSGADARVVGAHFEAGAWRVELERDGQRFHARAPRPPGAGETVGLTLQGERWCVPWSRALP